MKSRRKTFSPCRAAGSLFLSLVVTGALVATPASAVTITIKSNDAFQQGVNDPKPVGPVGGNPGTTLGAQRRFVFQHAANAWGLRLAGNVPIVVSASFQSLGGTANSAVLGSARPVTLERDFPSAPKILTWYVAGLLHQFAGKDRNDLSPGLCPDPLVEGKCPEIYTRFNGDVDGPTVLGTVDFYYGIDGNSGSDIDFLSVVLHELAHGLGVIDLIDPATGKISPSGDPGSDSCQNCSDAYSYNLENPKYTPKRLSQMTNNQRLLSIVDDGVLVWAGASVVAASVKLQAGVRGDGAVQIYAPKTYAPGSSISHFDTDVAPNELMEPFSSLPPPRDLAVSLAMLKDIGWTLIPVPRCGDANADAKTTTADALLALRGAVGSAACPAYLCDVNLSGGVTSADALLLLKRSVGQPTSLACPLA